MYKNTEYALSKITGGLNVKILGSRMLIIKYNVKLPESEKQRG